MNVKWKEKCESNTNIYLRSTDKTWKDEVFHDY